MPNHETTLELLRKLGELRSESYEINWDEWDHFYDEDEVEEMINLGIKEYEEKFTEMADSLDYYEDEIDETQAKNLEDVIDVLVQGYIYQHLMQRKRKIEEFISSI